MEFIGPGGKLELIRCKPTRPGEPDITGICWPEIIPGSKPFELEFDMALVAIGQKSPFAVGAAPRACPKLLTLASKLLNLGNAWTSEK